MLCYVSKFQAGKIEFNSIPTHNSLSESFSESEESVGFLRNIETKKAQEIIECFRDFMQILMLTSLNPVEQLDNWKVQGEFWMFMNLITFMTA